MEKGQKRAMIVFSPISFYDLLSLGVSALVSISIVITLILTARQLHFMAKQTDTMVQQTESITRQTQHMETQTLSYEASLKSSTYQNVVQQLLTIHAIFLEYPDVRPFFYGNTPIDDTNKHYYRVLAIAEMILDYYQASMNQSEEFSQLWDKEEFELYVVNAFSNSPILCSYLESLRDFYPSRLLELMEKGKARGVQVQSVQAFNNPISSLEEAST